MACVNCNKIRAAILHGKMAEAAGLTVEALREKIGVRASVEAPAANDAADEGEDAPAKTATKAK